VAAALASIPMVFFATIATIATIVIMFPFLFVGDLPQKMYLLVISGVVLVTLPFFVKI
jgi:hypothetical protein